MDTFAQADSAEGRMPSADVGSVNTAHHTPRCRNCTLLFCFYFSSVG